jgi:hypothetical protein
MCMVSGRDDGGGMREGQVSVEEMDEVGVTSNERPKLVAAFVYCF